MTAGDAAEAAPISPKGGELEFLHFQALAAWIKCAVLYWTASC